MTTNVTDPQKGFQLSIKTLYDIEKQLEIALPKMADAANDPTLKQGFLDHLEETKEHSKRLEKIFEMIEEKAEKHQGETIRGLLADGDALAAIEAPEALKDEMLAGAGRNVEHFEMACYMNAIEEAKGLDLTDAVKLLEMTLADEIGADEKLEKAVKESLKRCQEAS